MSQILQRTREWINIKALIVFFVLIVSAGLAYKGDRLGTLVLFTIPAVVVVLFLLRWPQWGLLAFIPTSMLIPFAIDTGTYARINITILLGVGLIGLLLFDRFVIQCRFGFIWSHSLLSLLGLCLASILAFLVGQLEWFVFSDKPSMMAQIGGLMIFLLSAGIFFLVVYQINDVKWLEWMTWSFLGLGGLYIITRLVPGFKMGNFFQLGSVGGLFWVWLISLAFGQTLFNRETSTHWRLLLGILTFGVFYAGFIQNRSWASGWLPGMVSITSIIFFAVSPKIRFIGLIIGVIIFFVFGKYYYQFVIFTNDEYSFLTRVEAYKILFEIIKVNPLLGFGPANYHYYTSLFPVLGYYVFFNSHNQYIDIVAQTGLLGLTFFIWFIRSITKTMWKLRNSILTAGFEKAYVYGCFGGLVGTLFAGMLADWFIPFLYNIGLPGLRSSLIGWIFLGGLVALDLKNSQTNSK